MSSSVKKITLKSSDGVTFEVDEAVAKHMMIGDGCTDTEIPVPNVKPRILAKVIEYCEKHAKPEDHANDSAADEELKAWDAEFLRRLDRATLCHLILAAKHFNMKELMDLIAPAINRDLVIGKFPEGKTFNIKEPRRDPEQMRRIRRLAEMVAALTIGETREHIMETFNLSEREMEQFTTYVEYMRS